MTKNNGTIKISISFDPELNRAIETMCVNTGLSKSRLIESILRENKDINRFIQAQRSEKGGSFTGKIGDSPKRNMKKIEAIKS